MLRRAQAAVLGVIVGSVGAVVFRLWGQISQIRWQLDWRYFLLSVGLVVGAILAWGWAWAWLLRKLGQTQFPLRQMASLYIYSNAAKYVPGGAWNYVARVYLGRQQGMAGSQVLAASLIEILGSLFTGTCLYSVSLFFPHTLSPIIPPALLSLLVILLLIALSPPAVDFLFKIWSSLRKIEYKKTAGFGWKVYVIYILASLLTWIIIGVAFFIFILGVYPISIMYATEVSGLWLLSFVVSLLAIGIPQGIGIREGFVFLALNRLMPVPVAVSIALLSRAWLVVCDILATLIWLLFDKVFGNIISITRTG